ncbi:MAG: hypothetical protein ACOX15_05355 [Tepidanaerobacteraceae bacterium]|jgi:hypothetical protein
MYIDTIGIILTIILVSPRYWLIVLSICASELILSFLLCLALKLNVVEVIAGGIFTSFIFEEKNYIQLISPAIFLISSLTLQDMRMIPWLDLINPLAGFKKPWHILFLKTSIFRLIIYLLF